MPYLHFHNLQGVPQKNVRLQEGNSAHTLAQDHDQHYTSTVRRHSQLNVKSFVLCVLHKVLHLLNVSPHCNTDLCFKEVHKQTFFGTSGTL